ncbi:MAG: GGDEF domain-containing protein [Phycisphaerae bacterium]|jgi:diguanylate cyclase (GGDEF)-like protein
MSTSFDIIAKLRSTNGLATPPGVVLKLLELTQQPDPSVREVSAAVAADPAITAKLLRYVNSPMAGVGREVASVNHAVALIGIRGVQMLALSFAVVSSEGPSSCSRFDRTQYALQSLASGVCAKHFAETSGRADAQEAFVAGLLSHFGRAAFAMSFPQEYDALLGQVQRFPADLFALEVKTFGVAGPAVAAELLRGWHVPEATCSAIGTITGPPKARSPLSEVLAVGAVAGFFVCPDTIGNPPEADEIIKAAEGTLKLTEAQCVSVLTTAATETQQLRQMMEVPSGKTRTAEEIELEVKERIAELTLAVNRENQVMVARQEDLLKRATTDPLTGVGNRAAFEARLTLELERAARSGAPLALLVIDVDHFKNFNDTHGHQAGDQVLCTIAQALDENVRKVDYVARYGGEEFVVVAPNAKPEGAGILAERLREAVESQTVPSGDKVLNATVSIGVGVATTVTDASDAKALFKAADDQLYKAKSNGRNRVEVMHDAVATTLSA